MSIWKHRAYVFLGTVVTYFVGQYFRGIWFEHLPVNLCLYSETPQGAYCNFPYLESVGLPLIATSKIFLIVAILLLFANASGLARWWRVSRWYLPISAILVIFLANSFSLPITGLLAPEFFVWLFGIPYILITLGIVLYTRLKKPKTA